MDPIYRLQNLKHAYNGKPALQIESLDIPANTILGFIGPNGSGKSTLLNLLACIERPSTGRIYFKGKPVEPFSNAIRFQVTLLTQEPYLMKRTVFKNVAYGLSLRGDRQNIQERVYEALSLVGLPGERFAHRKWFELSGGEAQRVALAARLILKPKVLLLDEPTASIDDASAQIVRDTVLMALQKWGTTLIIASHDWDWLYDICDKVMHLFRGRLFGSGRQNFLFGPWSKTGGPPWAKRLADGQSILVPPPPENDAVAAIAPEHVSISRRIVGSNHRQTCLQGTISRLIHEKNTPDLIAVIQVGNQKFTAKLSGDHARTMQLYPGMAVHVTYKTADIHWY